MKMSTTFEQADIQRLPKWAQLEISKLKDDLNYYKQQLAEFNGESDTNVFISAHPKYQPLPKNSRIVMKIDEETSFTFCVKGSAVEVTARTDHNKSLCILPCVSNGIKLESR